MSSGLVSLVLSCDVEVLRVLQRVLGDLNVSTLVASEPSDAAELLVRRKFDAFILECDDLPGAAGLLNRLRHSPSNRSTIAFALLTASAGASRAFALGANFVLDKPLSMERACRSFRAALGLMLRERRRYFRCAVEMPVTVDLGDRVVQQYLITNLSEGGLALRAGHGLPPGMGVKVSFTLPGTGTLIEARGDVAWASADGRAGIRMSQIPDAARNALSLWLGNVWEGGGRAPLSGLAPRGPATTYSGV